jgi:hypothetical protein
VCVCAGVSGVRGRLSNVGRGSAAKYFVKFSGHCTSNSSVALCR